MTVEVTKHSKDVLKLDNGPETWDAGVTQTAPLTTCIAAILHVLQLLNCIHLPAQDSGQQGHPDIHAVFCLTEVSCPWVCVHLHTEEREELLFMWLQFFFFFEDSIILLITLFSKNAIRKMKASNNWTDLISLTLGIGCITTIFFLATVMI